MNNRTDAASTIARIYKVSPRYVRLIISDTKREKYAGKRSNAIRTAYTQYESGKTNLIKAIEKTVKVA